MRLLTTRRVVLGGMVAAGAGAFAAWRHATADGGYEEALAEMTRPLGKSPNAPELIRYATLAANGHNTQPWAFSLAEGGVDISPDFSRRTPVVDPDDHHLYASLGCAAENLSIAARARGMSGEVLFDPSGDGRLHVDLAPSPAEETPLLAAITLRQSTRAPYDGSAVDAEATRRLEAAAGIEGVGAIFLTDSARKEDIASLVVAGNTRQMDDPAFMAELKSWIRFNRRSAAMTRDGLFSAASGNPALPNLLGSALFDLAFSKENENRKYVDHIRSSAGIVVLVARTDDPAGWVEAGRAAQRFALQATADGLKVAFVNQAVEDLPTRRDLQALLGLGSRRPNLVMRYGRGPALPRSLRRNMPIVG